MRPFPDFDNIHSIAIPSTQLPDLGTVNVFVLGSGSITLIDTGFKSPGSYEYLKEQLKQQGHHLADIERIILTHGHLDHFGLAESIRKEVDYAIPCFIHAEDLWKVTLENYADEMWSEYADHLIAMVGLPSEEVLKIKEQFSSFHDMGDPIVDAISMEDGDVFEGEGYQIRVIHTPGHSPGSSCLYETRQSILFSGDHIIKHITPNPLIEINREHLRNPHYQSLKAYMDSLDKLRELDVQFVFPGHGEYIEDLPAIIDSLMVHHQQRMDLVWKALKKKSRPLYQLIEDVFPYVPEDDIFLAISEIMVHLDILMNDGRVEIVDPGPPLMCRAL